MNGYNGWTNRETWLVGLWYNPESIDDVNYLEEWLPEEFDTMVKAHYGDKNGANSFFHDMIDFHAINWNELRGSIED